MARNVAVGIGLMEFPFSGAAAYWRWVDLCEAGGAGKRELHQPDPDGNVARHPILLACRRQLWPESSRHGKERHAMRIMTTVPQEDLRRVPAAAREAEAQGYDGIVTMENKHEPFLALAVAGTATERIELHTGVAIAFARTPMAVAEIGWDLAGATGGRFVVGLGSQVRAHNERRF